MGLEDTIIVSEADLVRLYQRSRNTQFLAENALLPLTAESLTTRQGIALLHLANFVYLSGEIRSSDFRPKISGRRDALDLIEELVRHLNLPFNYDCCYPYGGSILPARNSGLIGRLLYSMGVPKPNSNGNGKQTKARSQYPLPHYFIDIVKAKPDSRQARNRKQLVKVLLRDLFTNRLKIKEKNRPYLQLNAYEDENFARKYGSSVLRFLNSALSQPRDISFQQKQLSVEYHPPTGLYDCRIQVSGAQLGYLVRKKLINNL